MRVPRPSAALAAALVVAGCRTAPEAVEPPPLGVPELSVLASLEPGSTLSGPGRARLAPEEGGVLLLGLRLLYLEELPTGSLEPVESRSRLVVDLMGERPLLFGTSLAAGGRFAEGEAAREWIRAVEAGSAGRTVELFDEVRALPHEATLTLAASARETVADPLDWLDEFPERGPIERRSAIALTEVAGGVEGALSIDDLDPLAEEERQALALEAEVVLAAPPPPAEEEVVRRETLVLDVAPQPGSPLVLVWRSPFEGGEGRAFAALLSIEADGLDAATAAAAEERARLDLEQAASRHAERVAPLEAGGYEALRLEQALRAFRERGGRSALLLLADEAGAPLTADLVLFAEDELLAELAEVAFASDDQESSASADLGALGWRLERAAWTLLCRRASEDALAAEGRAALLRFAGALGRFPDALLDAVAASTDEAELRARILAEQLAFLEDPDPSARLRAHEWLQAVGAAVEGYDPLAERDARRAALRAHAAAREAQASEGGTP